MSPLFPQHIWSVNKLMSVIMIGLLNNYQVEGWVQNMFCPGLMWGVRAARWWYAQNKWFRLIREATDNAARSHKLKAKYDCRPMAQWILFLFCHITERYVWEWLLWSVTAALELANAIQSYSAYLYWVAVESFYMQNIFLKLSAKDLMKLIIIIPFPGAS